MFAHGSHLHVFCMVCTCRFHNSCPEALLNFHYLIVTKEKHAESII